MADEARDLAAEAGGLRRTIMHRLVAEDSLQHACILVGAISGRYTHRQACQAIGCTPAELNQSITSAGLAGEEMVRTAISGRFQWQGLWAHHMRKARAEGGPTAPADN